MPAIVEGIPERPFARVQCCGQETKKGIKLIFGIPGYDSILADPFGDRNDPDCADKSRRNSQRAGKRSILLQSGHN
jgi:hypothetical protein